MLEILNFRNCKKIKIGHLFQKMLTNFLKCKCILKKLSNLKTKKKALMKKTKTYGRKSTGLDVGQPAELGCGRI